MYKRDAVALKENIMPLKILRLDVPYFLRHCDGWKTESTRSLLSPFQGLETSATPSPKRVTYEGSTVVTPLKGYRADRPEYSLQFNTGTHFHCSNLSKIRHTCKLCSTKACERRANIFCIICKVSLCMNKDRYCFHDHHVKY